MPYIPDGLGLSQNAGPVQVSCKSLKIPGIIKYDLGLRSDSKVKMLELYTNPCLGHPNLIRKHIINDQLTTYAIDP